MLFDRMDKDMVNAMLETLPMELTVIDANDEVVGWNKHDNRLFKRPMSAMGLNFRNCHPQKSLDKVERIIAEMKAGTRERARFWINLPTKGPDKPRSMVLIEFYALRDAAGKYLGCMECTSDIQELRELQGEQRLLDLK
jgi:DUF438 domain-containing protein